MQYFTSNLLHLICIILLHKLHSIYLWFPLIFFPHIPHGHPNKINPNKIDLHNIFDICRVFRHCEDSLLIISHYHGFSAAMDLFIIPFIKFIWENVLLPIWELEFFTMQITFHLHVFSYVYLSCHFVKILYHIPHICKAFHLNILFYEYLKHYFVKILYHIFHICKVFHLYLFFYG